VIDLEEICGDRTELFYTIDSVPVDLRAFACDTYEETPLC
jgi:hypothetical protein